MVTIREKNPIKITPYVTYGIIIANILAFISEVSLPSRALDNFFHLFAVVPQELTLSLAGVETNQAVPELIPLIPSQFLHGFFLHLAGNVLSL